MLFRSKNRNLVEQFDLAARLSPDKALADIVSKARDLEKGNAQEQTSISYTNLLTAIGTNDIRKYFPTNYVLPGASSLPVTQQILNRVQRESASRFKLGIDLKGGTSFLLELDTAKAAVANGVSGTNGAAKGTNAPAAESMLSRRGDNILVEQAISVLRKRVDALGVAEPIIQPAGEKSILVQLPGLTEEIGRAHV